MSAVCFTLKMHLKYFFQSKKTIDLFIFFAKKPKLTNTSLIILIQPHHMRTITPITAIRVQQTQMRTTPIIHPTRIRLILIHRLSARMQNLHIKRLIQRLPYHRHTTPIKFIRTHHTIRPPIRPIHKRFKEGDGERVREFLVLAHHLVVIGAVVFGGVYGVGAGVHPENATGIVVEG